MDEEYTKDVDGIMSDCVAACRDLGLSLDDVQKCMIKKIKQIKKDDGPRTPARAAEGTGRIVPVAWERRRARRGRERDAGEDQAKRTGICQAGRAACRLPPSSRRGLHVVPDASTEIVGERASSTGVLLFSAVVFLLAFGLVAGRWWAIAGIGVAAIATALVCALLATAAVHIAQHGRRWSYCASARSTAVSGPGLFWTFPVIEQNTMRVDTRVRATTFAPRNLTATSCRST